MTDFVRSPIISLSTIKVSTRRPAATGEDCMAVVLEKLVKMIKRPSGYFQNLAS